VNKFESCLYDILVKFNSLVVFLSHKYDLDQSEKYIEAVEPVAAFTISPVTRAVSSIQVQSLIVVQL
jgi:hypothetical protein